MSQIREISALFDTPALENQHRDIQKPELPAIALASLSRKQNLTPNPKLPSRYPKQCCHSQSYAIGLRFKRQDFFWPLPHQHPRRQFTCPRLISLARVKTKIQPIAGFAQPLTPSIANIN
ncbi:hypothetical protein KEF85_02785 [Methylomonas paludis]|uniref:Uncharacterized protein n=1 Tax=Methylomonas paludis TaxID=1173101 RepID=A0A975MPJ4_9GAMM|nr:hypothetical protein [Methylomonas paludis]QWF71429.1 hypothetical protein KEF85_02785 [Methylomonas paludis]